MAKTIGFLGATRPGIWRAYFRAFKIRLNQHGPIGGEPVDVIDRWAQGRPARYREIAEEFAQLQVDAIVTSGTEPVIQAVAGAPGMPIVYASAGGPFNPPLPANVIGELNDQKEKNLAKRRFNILNRIFVRGADRPIVAVLGKFSLPNVRAEKDNIFGATGVGHEEQFNVIEVDVTDPAQIPAQIAALPANVVVLYVCTDPTITTFQVEIIAAANRRDLPTMFAFREYVEHGGLISLGPAFTEMFEKAADNVHAYLRGVSFETLRARAARPEKLVINTVTEAQIGVVIPQGVRNQAELWP